MLVTFLCAVLFVLTCAVNLVGHKKCAALMDAARAYRDSGEAAYRASLKERERITRLLAEESHRRARWVS